MKFDISIRNFGKIDNAIIKLRPFTVLAGPNSSGKSFITKGLYSFFSTINADHVSIETLNRTNDLKGLATYLRSTIQNPSRMADDALKSFISKINTIEEKIDDAFVKNTFSNQLSRSFLLKEAIDELEKSFDHLIAATSAAKYNKIMEYKDTIRQKINQLKKIAENPSECLIAGIRNGFINALKENFQVSNLSDLKNYHSNDEDIASFNFDTLGKIEIKKDALNFSLKSKSIDEFQKLNNVV